MLLGVKWYFWVLLAILFIAALFMWKKALKASRERRERLKKEAEIWKRDFELREGFRTLTEEKLDLTPSSELLHGVAMNIQTKLEGAPNMEKAFDALPLQKKYIYTLEYFDEDVKTALSHFFKNNGEPLIGLIFPALEDVGLSSYAIPVKKLYPMYDPESEVSVDRVKINEADEEFKCIYKSDELLRLSANYIKANKQIFLN